MPVLGLEPTSRLALLIGLPLLLFLVCEFIFDRRAIRRDRFFLLGFFCALTAGCLGFVITGSLGFNNAGVQATGGMALFALVFWFWRGQAGDAAVSKAAGAGQGPAHGDTTSTLRPTSEDQPARQTGSQSLPELLLRSLLARQGSTSNQTTIRLGRRSLLILIVIILGIVVLAFYVHPEISLTELPPYEPTGGPKMERIAGKVRGVNCAEVRVLVYAHTNGWFVQPMVGSEWIQIGPDCTWGAFIHTGDTYAALLVRPSPEFIPDPHPVTLPRASPNVLAVVELPGKR